MRIREVTKSATSRRTPRNLKEIKKTGERIRIRDMTQKATSRRTLSNKNEIRKNRRKNENP